MPTSKAAHLAWQRRRAGIPEAGWPDKPCWVCGSIFSPKSKRGRYCSKLCKGRSGYKMYRHKYNVRSKSAGPRPFLNALLSQKNRRSTLSLEYLLEMWQKQSGLCALSGVAMTHQTGIGYLGTNASIDRIDSSVGYLPGNVQLVCRRANEIKREFSSNDLADWCVLVLTKLRPAALLNPHQTSQ